MSDRHSNATRRLFLQAGLGASAAAGLAESGSGASAAETSSAVATAPRPASPRLIYNDDGFSVVALPHRVPMRVEQLTDLIDQLAGTGVGRYVFCLGNGRVAAHDTQVADRYWEAAAGRYDKPMDYRVGENTRLLVAQGMDPPAVLGRRARELGIEYYLSLRMNDAHFAYSKEGPDKSHTAGSFWRKFPEYRLGGSQDHYARHLFDYSHPAVRDFRLAYIEEACRKYPIDGFELDFMRHPFFFPPEVAADRADVMTGFMRSVRQLLTAVGEEKKTPLPLQVLVPRTLEACRLVGIDLEAWVREGLVDAIVPKHFIQFNMEIPVESFQAAVQGTSVEVYPCIEQRGEAGKGEAWHVFPDEKFRAVAARYWQAGVGGLYLYNFFNHRPHPLCQDDRRVLREISDPQSLQLRDKCYFLTAAENEGRRHYMPTKTTDLAGEERQIPRPLDERPEGHDFVLSIGDDPADAQRRGLLQRVLLRIETPGILPEGDAWELELNGVPIPADRQTCLPDPIAFAERAIDVDLTAGPWPVPGPNVVRLRWLRRHPSVASPVVVSGIELRIEYV